MFHIVTQNEISVIRVHYVVFGSLLLQHPLRLNFCGAHGIPPIVLGCPRGSIQRILYLYKRFNIEKVKHNMEKILGFSLKLAELGAVRRPTA